MSFEDILLLFLLAIRWLPRERVPRRPRYTARRSIQRNPGTTLGTAFFKRYEGERVRRARIYITIHPRSCLHARTRAHTCRKNHPARVFPLSSLNPESLVSLVFPLSSSNSESLYLRETLLRASLKGSRLESLPAVRRCFGPQRLASIYRAASQRGRWQFKTAHPHAHSPAQASAHTGHRAVRTSPFSIFLSLESFFSRRLAFL